MAKITIESFADDVSKLLEEYAEDISNHVEEATNTVAKKGAQLLKSESLSQFSGNSHLTKGRYGTGWTYKVERGRVGIEAVIYNSKYPGLPHLLEHGHAKRGGGFVAGRPHIAPVEEQIAKLYEEEVASKV